MDVPDRQENAIIVNSDAETLTDYDQLQKLRYEVVLIQRKEQAFRLRTAKVNEVEENKVALLMKQVTYRLQNEELLIAKDDNAREIRMAAIQSMKAKLDQLLHIERSRKAKESMIQEIFEEDAERMKFELASKIEKLASGEGVHGRLGLGVRGKRKSIPNIGHERQAKKRCTENTTPLNQRQTGMAPDVSQTIPSSTMIPETVLPNQSTLTEASGQDRPRHLWSCGFCGKPHPRWIDDKGKDILCECSPRSKIMWEVSGCIDDHCEQDSYSDYETVS